MENGSKILSLDSDAHGDSPGPQLLLELEPPYLVFFRNLAYTLLGQPLPRVAITSRPAPYWPDVFVYSGVPWWALLESTLWHMVAVVIVIALSRGVARERVQLQRFERSSYVTYSPPAPTFPARGSSRPKLPPRPTVSPPSKEAGKSADPPAMRVAQQTPIGSHTLVAPPDIAELTKRAPLPNAALPGAIAPEMPLSATTRTQVSGLAGRASVVGPPPDVRQAASWQQGAMQVTVVAPPPEVQAASSRRGVAGPGMTAVRPAPEVQGSAGRLGGVNAGHVQVAAPPPQLPMHEHRGGSGRAQAGVGGTGEPVVPPPPSVERSGSFGGGGDRAGIGGGPSLAAVPPAPSIQYASGSTGRGGAGLPGSSGLAAVPPAPSIEGAGSATARGGVGLAGGSGLGVVPPAPSLSVEGAAGTSGRRESGELGGGSGLGVVPPAPSVAGSGGGNGRGGMGFGGGSGLGAVPPAPSVKGSGNGNGRNDMGLGGGLSLGVVPPAPSVEGGGSGNGRPGIGMGGSGLAAVPPAPSLSSEGGAGSSGRGGMTLADSNPPVVPPPPSTAEAGKAAMDPGLKTVIEELHMRIVGLAFALPSTSFSSAYEVFIAERQLPTHAVQLIKLVYWFLPYQRRLSEYHPDYSKMYKLRATRDPACDESLVHMTLSPTGQSYSSAQLATLSPGFPSGNRDVVLPCYRITADDYRKALSRH